MGRRRFDLLARALAELLDRRQTLGAFLALLVALVVARDDIPAKKKGGKKGRGGKGKGKGKKNKRKKRRGGGGGGDAIRNCDDLALTPGADLHNCDLRQHPNLASANFTNAKLEDAILSDADLSGKSFRGARLWRAKLNGADLQDADFDPENGQKTDIFETDFTDADLQGADLDPNNVLYAHYAIFCRTTMPNGDSNDDNCAA
jgi:hypothetical protein